MAFGKKNNFNYGGGKRGKSSFASPNKGFNGAARGRNSIPRGVPTSGLQSNNPNRMSRGSMLKVILVVILAFVLAGGVGVLVYKHNLKSATRPDIDLDALSQVLVDDETDNSWTLFVHTDASSAEAGRGNVVDLALVHVDAESNSLTFLWIPANTRVYVAGYGYKTVAQSFELGREVALIDAVSKFTNMVPEHYMEVNDLGLSAYVESVGNINVDDGTELSVVAKAVVKRIFGSSSEQIPVQAHNLIANLATDFSEEDLSALFAKLQGSSVDENLHQAEMPISSTEQSDPDAEGNTITYSIVATEPWARMVERVSAGRTPIADDGELQSNDAMREAYDITIWNGVGVTGIAADCATHLENLGWRIESTGNAASFVYDETLIVYKYDNDETLADLVVADLGQGRAVRSAARYAFEGRILVVVGKNYQPY